MAPVTSYNRKRIFSFLLHVMAIFIVLEILGVGELISHPVVLTAVFVLYYDLWIKG